MKALFLLVLLVLGGVLWLVMMPEKPPPPKPTEPAPQEPAAVEAPATVPEPVKTRTPEEIRADVARKAAEAAANRPPPPPQADPMAAKNARRAEFQAKIDAKRAEMTGVDSAIAAKKTEIEQAASRVSTLRSQVSKKNKQWRYVVGGKVNEREMTWHGIDSLPSVAARNGRTVRYRDVPAYPSAPAELQRAESRLNALRNEQDTLRNKRLALDSEVANLGLQMNMRQ